MNYHETVEKITKLLNENGVWHETFEHQPVRTSEEAANVRPGYGISEGAKALIIKVKKNHNVEYAMVVIPGDMKFKSNKVKKIAGAKDITFANEEEVEKLTAGVKPGGVPPFGNIFNLPVYADNKLLDNEKMVFNAGDKSFSVAMNTIDYKNIVNPIMADLT
jgi:Ala-tRNA(Pro) deacylase